MNRVGADRAKGHVEADGRQMRRKGRAILWTLALASALTLLSTLQPAEGQATYSEIMGCEQSCRVAAAGWPFPYLVDYPGLSVAGSADLVGALLGEDRWRLVPLALTFLFWAAVAFALMLSFRSLPKRR